MKKNRYWCCYYRQRDMALIRDRYTRIFNLVEDLDWFLNNKVAIIEEFYI